MTTIPKCRWFEFAVVFIGLLSLCGCPLRSPSDHLRPNGHLDTTLDVAPTNDALVFSAAGDGGRDLFLLQLDDLIVTRVAETPEYETFPSFSSDGKKLVYSAGSSGDRADHIFVRAVAGGPAHRLTHADANDVSPRFSPDDKMVVFARDKKYKWGGLAANWNNGGVICLIGFDGTNERQITEDDDFAFDPRFSVDGKSVVFSTPSGLKSVPVEGTGKPERIQGESGAVPSPDRTLYAYSKGQYGPDLKIYVSKADGSDNRLTTPNFGGCQRPLFSHSGDRLFFLHEEWPDGPTGTLRFSLWEVTLDGTPPRQLADRQLFDDPLAWKPKAPP